MQWIDTCADMTTELVTQQHELCSPLGDPHAGQLRCECNAGNSAGKVFGAEVDNLLDSSKGCVGLLSYPHAGRLRCRR
jgi:hypothetical protein